MSFATKQLGALPVLVERILARANLWKDFASNCGSSGRTSPQAVGLSQWFRGRL
jgi:hypothetical protein